MESEERKKDHHHHHPHKLPFSPKKQTDVVPGQEDVGGRVPVHGLPGLQLVRFCLGGRGGSACGRSGQTRQNNRVSSLKPSIQHKKNTSRRSYADPDFKTPEQYERERWMALMAAKPGKAGAAAGGAVAVTASAGRA
jgi:hypothetical protein